VYDKVGAEKFAVRPQSHQRKSSMLVESLGGRMAETLRGFQDRSQVYDGTVPAAVHGAPHTLKVQNFGFEVHNQTWVGRTLNKHDNILTKYIGFGDPHS